MADAPSDHISLGPWIQCARVAAFKAAGASERNVGVIRRNGHADLGVGRIDLALGRGNIRSALEQLRGNPDGYGRNLLAQWHRGEAED